MVSLKISQSQRAQTGLSLGGDIKIKHECKITRSFWHSDLRCTEAADCRFDDDAYEQSNEVECVENSHNLES